MTAAFEMLALHLFHLLPSVGTVSLVYLPILTALTMVAPDEEAIVRCETTKGPITMKLERVSSFVIES